jgi:hypothetical protein
MERVAALMNAHHDGGRLVTKTLPGDVLLHLAGFHLVDGGVGVSAGVDISVPGRFFLKLVYNPSSPRVGREPPPPFQKGYRLWGGPEARVEEAMRRISAPLDEVRPREFDIGILTSGGDPADAQLSAVKASAWGGAMEPQRVMRVANLVDEVARRLDPLAFTTDDDRSERLANALSTRLPWANPTAGAGHGAMRARFVIEELGERVTGEARVNLSKIQARINFRASLPAGPRLHLERSGFLRSRFDKLRCGIKAVDTLLFASSPDPKSEAEPMFQLIAPALAELYALEGEHAYAAKIDVEPEAFAVESGPMSRGSILPYLESLVWSWRALFTARMGEEAAVPAISWFG